MQGSPRRVLLSDAQAAERPAPRRLEAGVLGSGERGGGQGPVGTLRTEVALAQVPIPLRCEPTFRARWGGAPRGLGVTLLAAQSSPEWWEEPYFGAREPSLGGLAGASISCAEAARRDFYEPS